MDGDWSPIPHLEGAWAAERARLQVPLRSVAIRLADERLAVYSPVKGIGADGHQALAGRGVPAWLVSPNLFHHLGLPEYARRHPGVAIAASARAIRRVAAKSGLEVEDESRLRAALPSHANILVPPGTRNGELWLSIAGAAGRAWIVGDGFFNIARTPRSFIGFILWAWGTLPGLRIGGTYKLLVQDRSAYKRWVLAALRAERPTMLVPCHGDILVDPALPDRLEALIEQRLG